jgi:hypothetical protein
MWASKFINAYKLESLYFPFIAPSSYLAGTCPESRYNSYYECFQNAAGPVLNRATDTTSAVLLSAVGVMAIEKDKKENRRSHVESMADLYEMTTGFGGKLSDLVRPSKFSFSAYDQFERSVREKYLRMLVSEMELHKDSPELDRLPANDSNKIRITKSLQKLAEIKSTLK